MREDSVSLPPSTGFDLLAEQDTMAGDLFGGEWFNALGTMT